MQRIIIPMFTLLGLVLLMSAQCDASKDNTSKVNASNVNINGTYENTKTAGTTVTSRYTLKRGNGNKVTGTFGQKLSGLPFLTLADVAGELKDDEEKIILNLTQTTRANVQTKMKFTVLDNGATLKEGSTEYKKQ